MVDKEFLQRERGGGVGGGGDSNTTMCSICCEEYRPGGEVKRLPCGHMFHAACCLPWFEKKEVCPYCRFDVGEAKKEEERRQYEDDDSESFEI